MIATVFVQSEACGHLQMRYQSLNKNAWIHQEHQRGRCPRAGCNIPLTDEGWLPEQCPHCGEGELRSLTEQLKLERGAEQARKAYHATLKRETEAWLATMQMPMGL